MPLRWASSSAFSVAGRRGLRRRRRLPRRRQGYVPVAPGRDFVLANQAQASAWLDCSPPMAPMMAPTALRHRRAASGQNAPATGASRSNTLLVVSALPITSPFCTHWPGCLDHSAIAAVTSLGPDCGRWIGVNCDIGGIVPRNGRKWHRRATADRWHPRQRDEPGRPGRRSARAGRRARRTAGAHRQHVQPAARRRRTRP